VQQAKYAASTTASGMLQQRATWHCTEDNRTQLCAIAQYYTDADAINHAALLNEMFVTAHALKWVQLLLCFNTDDHFLLKDTCISSVASTFWSEECD
jgi:hypothetical protein